MVTGAKTRVLPLVVAFLLGAGVLALIALVAGLWDRGSNR
jgi:hypothetical protein